MGSTFDVLRKNISSWNFGPVFGKIFLGKSQTLINLEEIYNDYLYCCFFLMIRKVLNEKGNEH